MTGVKPMPRNKCRAEGCELLAKHPVSGLCGKHYKRMQRTGGTSSSRREIGIGTITSSGYIAITSRGKKKQAHVLVVEAILGVAVTAGIEIHHVNGVKSDNTNTNLVVCPNKAYHKLLHTRQDAMQACGNPDYRKCPFCKEYDDPAAMTKSKHGRHYYHAKCKTAYGKKRREK